MSGEAPSSSPPRRAVFFKRRAFKLVAGVFAAQWVLFLGMGLLNKETVPPVPRLLVARLASSEPGELAELADPGVFAGAHRRGFSTALPTSRREDASLFEPSVAGPVFPPPTAPPQPPVVLSFDERGAGAPLRAEPPLATPAEGRAADPVPTAFYFSGALKGRPVLEKPAPGPQQHSDVLSNSVVQLVVTADGEVFSTRLISGSGSRKADLDALDLAAKLRFAPSTQPLQQGDWTIRWQTLPPAK